MSTAPASPASRSPGRLQALYQSTLQEAAVGAKVLMGKLIDAARLVLQAQEAALRDLRERDAVATASNQLRRQEQALCDGFPVALLAAFAGPPAGKKSLALSVAEVHFDQLELMDESQVLTSVTLARIQQSAAQLTEASLSELNTLVCGLQGLPQVRADHNPLRPEIYVQALKAVVEQTGLPTSTQLLWFNAMSATLGTELRKLYTALCVQLRQQGVAPVAYAMPAGFGSQGGAAGTAASRVASGSHSSSSSSNFQGGSTGIQSGPVPVAYAPGAPGQTAPGPAAPPVVRGRDEALLTLDKLRQLLAGELAPVSSANRMEQFAAQFAQQFEDAGDAPAAGGSATAFDATVPAALEALTEMKQVERVVQSLEQRRSSAQSASDPQAHSVEGQRLALRRNAKDMAQALSLEVVTLMVDNMARDPRLLEPVRQVVRNLEPALLRLALVDPRFFSDKQHPARRLLHELTHRSLAFESSAATGFERFVSDLQGALGPLFQAPIENAEVFEHKLAALQLQWNHEAQATAREREVAVDMLRHAEARNLLAEKIARSIDSHPDSAQVPAVVTDFLCGPWAQVVAQARIKQGAGSAAAERFEALIPALLWSAHPELAKASPSKLTRVVPRLLTTLREGLETIHYPVTRTSVFLEALMAIHQKVFRAQQPADTAGPAESSPPAQAVAERPHRVVDGDPWIAPQEALASNFVELQDTPDGADPQQPPVAAEAPAVSAMPEDFALGCWVEMRVHGEWLRTQLTWASPHGTLYLFTGAFGTTNSMTRRSRDKLLSSGHLRVVSGQAVDEGALDAVAQTAMRNSLDSVI